jgi:hypothetical protein
MIKSIIVSCRRVSLEYKRCFILHMDIKKYFESIDHNILINIISENKDLRGDIFGLTKDIIKSFEVLSGKGIPLGNVTSQIFANIYLSEFDKILIRQKKCHFYTRYNDDIFIVHNDIDFLKEASLFSMSWLRKERNLSLPNEKIKIRKISNGCNVLGVVIYKNKLKLKNSTKQRIFERISMKNKNSYFGMLKHPDFFDLKQKLRSILDL